MSLTEVPPEPIDIKELPEDKYVQKKILGIPLYPLSGRSVVIWLRRVQKYSTIPMAVYFPLHAVNTLIVPAISPHSAPDDVLMMVRELLPSFTTKLLVVSLSLHLLSGVTIRIWQLWSRIAAKDKRKHRHHHHRKEKQLRLTDATERDSQRLIGLTGGLSGYFMGFNKEFTILPQTLTGYILGPLLAYHLAIMRFIPDSSKMYIDVDFNYVKWILQHDDWRIRWAAGIIPLSLLIWSGTYHIVAGICQYLKIKDISTRRKWSNFIIILSSSGLLAVYRLSKWSATVAASQQYDKIFKKLYLL